MPARPRPRDIVMYNAWADRMGQPRWGADAPAAVPAAAAAPRRRGRQGLQRPDPSWYGDVDPVEGGGWQRGTWWVNRQEWAFNAARNRALVLRSWNSRTGEYRWTDAGRNYYDHNVQKFIWEIPAKAYKIPHEREQAPNAAMDVNLDGSINDEMLRRATLWHHGPQQTRTIPLPDNFVDEEFVYPQSLLRARDAAIVPDRDNSREISEAEAGTRIREALSRLPRVLTEDGMLHKVAIDSELVWVWDEAQVLTFSEQVFRHMYSQPIVETLLDRPLRGAPYIEHLMYGRHGLAEMATKDLTDRKGCVVAQIVELVTKRMKVTPTSGGRTTLSGDR